MDYRHIKSKTYIGAKFNRLTIKDVIFENEQAIAVCQCDCGNEEKIVLYRVKRGIRKECKACSKSHRSKNNLGTVDNIQIANMLSGVRKNSKSGIRGVTWDKKSKKWRAQITINGVHHRLGSFFDLKDAANARKQAEEKYWGPILEKYKEEVQLLHEYQEGFVKNYCPICGKEVRYHPRTRMKTCGNPSCVTQYRRRNSLSYKGKTIGGVYILDVYYKGYKPIAVCKNESGVIVEYNLKSLKRREVIAQFTEIRAMNYFNPTLLMTKWGCAF